MTGLRGRAAAAAVFFLASFIAFSQDEGELPFPFVSQLSAEAVGFQVKLTWRDSHENVARYLVYRHDQEMTTRNLSGARMLGQVKPGVQYFLDMPPDEKEYFYALLAQDSQGKTFATLIPFRNKTLVGVAVTTPATEEQLAARISDIQAVPTPAGDGVEVTFRSSSTDRDLLVFRSTSPIMRAEDLLRSATATQFDAGVTRAVISAFPGVDYWFTVLDARLYKLGSIPISPGANTTIDPVQVSAGTGSASLAQPSLQRRILPLPSLEITYGIETGKQLPGASFGPPPVRSLSPAAQKAVSVLLAAVPQPRVKELSRAVLPADATPSPDAEDTMLQTIVKGPFMSGNAATSERELLEFLSMKRAPEMEARAHYYLGQTYYFDNQPRKALLEFLLAEDWYYHEAEQWQDACFTELEKEEGPGP
ncbi:MAG: hypothetical protein ABSG38_05320 [Spirochaetia bacterium]|jgi:hypothetical protein